jgi:hypothetical protein
MGCTLAADLTGMNPRRQEITTWPSPLGVLSQS